MPLDLSPYHAVLLDLDGTIYHDDQILPGAAELVGRLVAENRKFACLTNASASPARISDRLAMMNLAIDPSHIYTAAAATCDFVREKFVFPDRRPRIFNLATESVAELLDGAVDWVQKDDEPCDAVVVSAPGGAFNGGTSSGDGRQLSAMRLARSGAAIVGICADRVFPSPRGFEFGSGAATWMIAYAAGVEPIFCGKPQPIFFRELCRRLNVEPGWCLLIGDNFEADICGAKQVGMRTILTLSGVTRPSDLMDVPDGLQPDLIIEDLRELI